jgi:hypothetical protein
MSEENELGAELLKQDGLSVGEIIAEERRQLEKLVQHEQRTSRLLLRIALVALAVMLISLLVVPLVLVLMHLSGSGWGEHVKDDWVLLTLPLNVTAIASAIVAVVCGPFAISRSACILQTSKCCCANRSTTRDPSPARHESGHELNIFP